MLEGVWPGSDSMLGVTTEHEASRNDSLKGRSLRVTRVWTISSQRYMSSKVLHFIEILIKHFLETFYIAITNPLREIQKMVFIYVIGCNYYM